MLTMLKGEVERCDSSAIDINVNGIVFCVTVCDGRGLFYKKGDNIAMHVVLHIKDDAVNLYGFDSTEDKYFFKALYGIHGVGPKIALNIIKHFSVNDIANIVFKNDSKALTKISGVGPKLAARIVIELQGIKLPLPDNPVFSEALSAIRNLGFEHYIAHKAVGDAISEDIRDFDGIVKYALRKLSE